MIYFVLIIIVALFIKEGVFLLLPVCFVYLKRFPKTYWIYFLLGGIAVIYMEVAGIQSLDGSTEPLHIEHAKVIEVKKQDSNKQTAKIWTKSGYFYLTLQAEQPRLLPGDWIEVNQEASMAEPPRVFHGFDFKNYLYTNGMRGTVYLNQTRVIDHEWSARQYQRQVANWVEEHYPTRTATYIPAWFLGVRDGLDEAMSEGYSNLGIIHLFAVSGLHVGLLIGIVGYMFKRVGIVMELADSLIIILLVGFMILSGASPSIVRAGGMAILARLNQRMGWGFSSLDLFSLIFLINFILFPLQVYQTGFIYSYWLTFCLIVSQSMMKRISGKFIFLFVPLIAQLAVLPIQLFLSYEINLAGYVANLCLVPIVSSLLIPLLLLTLWIPPLATIIEYLLTLFEKIILISEQFLKFNWIIGQLHLTSVVFIIILLVLVAWLLEKPRVKRKSVCLILLGVVLILEGERILKTDSQVTFVDVGQGDSMVMQSPFQMCTTVIDTGGKVSFTGEKIALFERTLEPYLLGEGVRQIDYLILTHGDFDHVGEAISLLERFEVKYLVIPKNTTSDHLREITQVAKRLGVLLLSPEQGEKVRCGNQEITFLQPDTPKDNENDKSLVMKVTLDQVTFLFTGDVSAQVEAEILRQYPNLRADIYKAAHHGSKTSNSHAFLTRLQPQLTIISSGKNNRYRHPSSEVLETHKQLEIPMLNTQDHGSIQVKIRNGRPNLHTAIRE